MPWALSPSLYQLPPFLALQRRKVDARAGGCRPAAAGERRARLRAAGVRQVAALPPALAGGRKGVSQHGVARLSGEKTSGHMLLLAICAAQRWLLAETVHHNMEWRASQASFADLQPMFACRL